MSRFHKASRLTIPTQDRCQMVEVTDQVQQLVRAAGVREGIAYLHCPHTTAGLCINENADPDVKRDLLAKLERLVPKDEPFYRHAEGNSDSHLKAILMGSGLTVLIDDGRLVLGRWQGIYFCEYDGPRTRELIVRLLDHTREPLT